MKKLTNYLSLILIICFGLFLGSCATGQPVVGPSNPDQKSAADSPNALQITDIPLPAGAKLDAENSLIIGANDHWLGRIVIKADSPAVQVFNHFYTGMPSFGWVLITAMQTKVSILSYQRADRIALIQLESLPLGGTVVTINLSQRQAPTQEPIRKK